MPIAANFNFFDYFKYPLLKRSLDFVLSMFGLIILSPFFVILSILIACFISSPVFFKQKRTGLNGKSFSIYKFKTMTEARDASGALLPDVERLNRLGRFLRNWSIDELPQLFNVARGDMSLVGPRPQLVQYTTRIKDRYLVRFSVRPGITGWAQVNGRNNTSWEKRFRLDEYYVKNQSLCLDLKILLQTPIVVIKRKDILHTKDVTMPPL